ncbi:hypothetical protein AVEN_74589-1 [Araneus ventricosus]|uniref:Peptidase S1 domain-containing protein n=1 Tax=Araneus ventricosus TaxID=182803 RepID=A0A4Y2MGV2_ARAVE|nr:hypothetical protein AVEN_74589-1 [Araneus ventricosus]
MPRECYVQTSDVKVRLPWRESNKFRKTLQADKLLPHPDYDHECKRNDIALIRVSQDIECNSFKQPICVPTSDLNKFGGKLIIAGWGQITPDGIPKSSQMRLGLPSTVIVGDRFGVSDRAVVAIASSVLHDVGLITSNNSDLVVDENMLRREKAKVRKDLKFQALIEAQALSSGTVFRWS